MVKVDVTDASTFTINVYSYVNLLSIGFMMKFNAISWHYATREIKGTAVIKFIQQSFIKEQGIILNKEFLKEPKLFVFC